MRSTRTVLATVVATAMMVAINGCRAEPAETLPATPSPAVSPSVSVSALPPPASVLTEVKGFGPNPTNLKMYLYVPDRPAARPAVLVAAHYCGGSGPMFFSGSEFASLADRYGFIVIYPSTNRSYTTCFDVSTAQALTRDGGSDPMGVVAMVRYVLAHHHADPARVFATGFSSGAMLTNVLLAEYPDVFAAGSAFAGVPYACLANDGEFWNEECGGGRDIRTARAWGDQVRAAYPGYTGPRPRMQVWHGTNDDTLAYPNFTEEIKQWTDVHGLSQAPTCTDTPQATWTRTRYGGRQTMAPVEGISVASGDHDHILRPGMAAYAIAFFGLNAAP